MLCQVDSLEFYVARLQELVRQIRAAREQLRDRPEASMPAAFVTFRGRVTQVGFRWFFKGFKGTGLPVKAAQHVHAEARLAQLPGSERRVSLIFVQAP